MAPQRRWKIHQQQQALLEFAGISKHPLPGVYVSYHPSNPCQWSGVYFVRTGSYATAPLRFTLTVPPQYPEVAPVLVFSNDIFHPLVCPWTTATYSTASPSRQPVSSADDKRLSPGSLNLQYGFPEWFQSDQDTKATAGAPGSPSPANGVGPDDLAFSDDEFNHNSPPSEKPKTKAGTAFPFMTPPRRESLQWSSTAQRPSIAQVLRYMIRAFEDESFLDDVPLDLAANSSAHYAWTSYRKRVKEAEAAKEAKLRQSGAGATPAAPATPQHRLIRQQMPTASPGRSPAQWNWDGVWQDRVRQSVKSATADGKLYKDDERGDGHHLITFLDRQKDDIVEMKKEAFEAGKKMAA